MAVGRNWPPKHRRCRAPLVFSRGVARFRPCYLPLQFAHHLAKRIESNGSCWFVACGVSPTIRWIAKLGCSGVSGSPRRWSASAISSKSWA
eukprot:7234576-Lingulodinium_polyedra.AAC.1